MHSLAAKAGVAKSYLAKLEKGQVENPGLQTLHALADALGLTLADLISPNSRATDVRTEDPAATFERTLANLPPGLGEFIGSWEQENRKRLSPDIILSLAQIQFRGKRPQTAEDWRFVYNALDKSI